VACKTGKAAIKISKKPKIRHLYPSNFLINRHRIWHKYLPWPCSTTRKK